MIRFLHSSDWQLGMTRSVLGDEAQARFADARFDAIRRMAAIARDERCDFVVVCGDVFESNQVERRTLARAIDALAEFSQPVYLLPGNHDPLDAGSVFRSAAYREAAPDGVHLLDDTRPREVAPGVELIGAPWQSRRPEMNPVHGALESIGGVGALRILAAHGGADLLYPERRDATRLPLAPIERAIEEGRLHYVALGDRHSHTRVGSSARIFYSGAQESTDFGEVDPGHVLVVEAEHERVDVRAQRVGQWCFEQPEPIDLDGADDLDALEERLAAYEEKARCALRLELRGRLGLPESARLEAMLERGRDLFAGLDVRRDALRIDASGLDLDSLALSGFAAAAAARLREEASGDDDSAGVARDALGVLLRLAGDDAVRP